jgi:hypothetical protein
MGRNLLGGRSLGGGGGNGNSDRSADVSEGGQAAENDPDDGVCLSARPGVLLDVLSLGP